MSETDQVHGIVLQSTEKPTLSKLKAALAKAQLEIFNPMKNRAVDISGKDGKAGFGYEYAELCAVIEIIRKPLATNGLTFTQEPRWDLNAKAYDIVTTIMHESGEEKEFLYPLMPLSQLSAEKGFAGGFTYGKRQALKGLFAIADDTEDKDAQDPANVRPKEPKPDQKNQSQSKPKPELKIAISPALFVMPVGAVQGKKLGDLPEATLKSILDWSEVEMAKKPPAKNLKQILEINSNVKAQLAFHQGVPAVQTIVAADLHPADTPQVHATPENESQETHSIKKKDDPGDFLMPLEIGLPGTSVILGQPLSKISENRLRSVLAITTDEIQQVPPRSNLGALIEINTKVRAFLQSVGVEL